MKGLLARRLSRPSSFQGNAFAERQMKTDEYERWALREGHTVEGPDRILEERGFAHYRCGPLRVSIISRPWGS